jgi:hypothetical protein
MDKISRVLTFKIVDNASAKTVDNEQQRTASVIANNSNHELDYNDKKDTLCASMISEIVKLAGERVKSKGNQRTAASVIKPVNEVLELKTFFSNYSVKLN